MFANNFNHSRKYLKLFEDVRRLEFPFDVLRFATTYNSDGIQIGNGDDAPIIRKMEIVRL